MIRIFCLLPLLLIAGCAVPLPPEPGMPAPAATDQEPTVAEVEQPTPEVVAPPQTGAKPSRRAAAAAGPPPPVPPDLDSQPVEEVIVKPISVTGYWRLTASRTIDLDVGLFSGIHIRYGGEVRDRNICWLQQKGDDLAAMCSSGAALKSAEGSVHDDGISMRWWVGPGTIIFSGKFTDANRIAGGFSGGVAGLSVTGDVPATLTRLDLPDPPPAEPERPSAALLRLVWEDVRAGKMTDGRYEGSALKRVAQGLTKDIAADPPQGMLYLGQILIRWRQEQRETLQDVYQVQTAAGRKMCRIAVNDSGQVVDVNCLVLPH